MPKADLVTPLLFQLKALKIAAPEMEVKFHPTRRWRFDLAWPAHHVALEIEGGIWSGGAHTRGAHFMSDCEKYNEAAILGWTVFRVATNHIKNGQAADWAARILKARGAFE